MRPDDWLRLMLQFYGPQGDSVNPLHQLMSSIIQGDRGWGIVNDYSTPNPYNAYNGMPITDQPPALSLDAYRNQMPLGMNGGTPDGPLYGNRQAGAMPLARA